MKIETSCQISRTNTHCDPGGFPDVNLNVIVNDLFGQLDSEAQSGPMTFDRPPAQQCIQSQDSPRASVSDYVADLFTTEDHLEDALSLIGPTVTGDSSSINMMKMILMTMMMTTTTTTTMMMMMMTAMILLLMKTIKHGR